MNANRYPYKFYVDVDGKKYPASREDNPPDDGSAVMGKHYDQHLIVMQQDLADVGVMGAYLQNKHLLKTALWHWGDGGVYRRIAGIELEPGATTELTLLGHGNRWFRTLGGRDGFELGAQVSVIQAEHDLVIPKVYAFGCYADCEINGSSLVRDLRHALHGFGIDAEVKGPPGPIIATPDGRKVKLDAPVPGSMGQDEVQHVLILEDSDDPQNEETVRRLRLRFPGLVVVRADKANRLHPHSGTIKDGVPTIVIPNSHGDPVLRTIGGHGADDMAAQIKSLQADHDLRITDVELAACNAAACNVNGVSIENDLQVALSQLGIDATVKGVLGELALLEDGTTVERAPSAQIVANHRAALVDKHKRLTTEIRNAERTGSSVADLRVELARVEADIHQLMKRMHARAKADMLTSRTPGRTAIVDVDGELAGYTKGNSTTVVMPNADGTFPRIKDDIDEDIRRLVRGDLDRLKGVIDDTAPRLQARLGRAPTPAEIESDPVRRGALAEGLAITIKVKALEAERDALASASGSQLTMGGASDPEAFKALRDVKVHAPGKQALLDALSKAKMPEPELFDRIPDGRITAMVMANYDIDMDFVAVRAQDRKFTDFEHGVVRGHQATNATVTDMYDSPRVGWGGAPVGTMHVSDKIMRATDQEGLNVLLVPREEVAEVVKMGRYANDGRSYVMFPLRDALERGARLYPDESSPVRTDRGYPFMIALPKGTQVPVVTHEAASKTADALAPEGTQGALGSTAPDLAPRALQESMMPSLTPHERALLGNLHALDDSHFLGDDEVPLTQFLFRGDARDPGAIFLRGFEAWERGPDAPIDLAEHQLGDTKTNFVSLSKVPSVATGFANYMGLVTGRHVFVTRGQRGLDVNKRLPFSSQPDQYEVAVPDAVPPETILGAYNVTHKGIVAGSFRPNPRFEAHMDREGFADRQRSLLDRHAAVSSALVETRGRWPWQREPGARAQLRRDRAAVEKELQALYREQEVAARRDAHRHDFHDMTLKE